MKKSYFIMPFPLVVLACIAFVLSVLAFYLGRISLLPMLFIVCITMFIVTYKLSYSVNPYLSELKIYNELLFFKYNIKLLMPNNIVVITRSVVREETDAKYGGGGIALDYSYRMLIYGKVDSKVLYEKSGSIDDLEELGVFICDSLKIELRHKSMQVDISY